MNIETLDLKKPNETKNIKLSDWLNSKDEWESCNSTAEEMIIIKKLSIQSNIYNYYIAENSWAIGQRLYRCKK